MPQLDNPVLEGYLRGLAMRREREEKDRQFTLEQAQSDRAEKQLTATIKNMEAEQKQREAQLALQRGGLELQTSQLGLERQAKEMQMRDMLSQMISSGRASVRQPTQGEQLSTPIAGPVGGAGGIDPRTIQYSTPEQLTEQAAKRAAAMGNVAVDVAGRTAGAQAAAKAPWEQISRASEHQLKMMEEAEKAKNRLAEVDKTIEGHKAVARITGQFGLDEARIRNTQPNISPEEWTNLVTSYASGENEKTLGTTPRDMLIKTHLQSAGFQEIGKKQADKLKEMHSLDPMKNLMEETVAKLPTTWSAAIGDKVVANYIPASDRKALATRIASVAGNVSKMLGGESSRLTEQDIDRALGMAVRPGMTIKQATDNLKFFMANYTNKIDNVILGGVSPRQKLFLLRRYDFDPEMFNKSVTKADGTTDKMFKQANDGEWGWYDTKEKKYKGVGDK